MTTVLDESGRVEIPEPIRKALGWKPGTAVEVRPEADGVVVCATDAESCLKREGKLLVFTGKPERDVDIVALINADREERMRRIAGIEL